MPGRLQTFVENGPVTHLASAVRGLVAGGRPADEVVVRSPGRPALVVLVTLVFGPGTMRLCNRK